MVETDTKQIDCPEHPGKHTALLYCYPHQHAGIWECPEGLEDSHEHPEEDLEIEDTVQDHMGFQGHYQTEGKVYVCGICGVTIEDRDPEADATEARADYEADNWRQE
jgi:hypothetical protein